MSAAAGAAAARHVAAAKANEKAEIKRMNSIQNRPGSPQDAKSEGEEKKKRKKKKEFQFPDYKWRLCYQKEIYKSYMSDFSQISVAIIIFINFILSAAQAQILPTLESNPTAFNFFKVTEWIFANIFGIELIWNMYGSWCGYFWYSGWNVFDFIIVIISYMSLLMENLPGIAVLRLFRSFRVFRLFKRVPALRAIISNVLKSIPGVSNAFLVMIIIMGIWSIMGVEFFMEDHPEYFANFGGAMITMFQMMTMDGWCSGIAREVIFNEDLTTGAAVIYTFYFVTFILITGIIMTNVVVAILIEKYLEPSDDEDEEEEEEDEEIHKITSTTEKSSSADSIQQYTPPKEETGDLLMIPTTTDGGMKIGNTLQISVPTPVKEQGRVDQPSEIEMKSVRVTGNAWDTAGVQSAGGRSNNSLEVKVVKVLSVLGSIMLAAGNIAAATLPDAGAQDFLLHIANFIAALFLCLVICEVKSLIALSPVLQSFPLVGAVLIYISLSTLPNMDNALSSFILASTIVGMFSGLLLVISGIMCGKTAGKGVRVGVGMGMDGVVPASP